MTVSRQLSWQPMGNPGDYAAQEQMDFSVDLNYKFDVNTVIQGDVRVTPKFIIVDNTPNAYTLTVTLKSITILVPAATRNTIQFPVDMKDFQITSAGAVGTASVIVSETQFVEDVSNQTAVVIPPTPGGNMSIVRTVKQTVGADSYTVPANCIAFEVEVAGGGGGGGSTSGTAGASACGGGGGSGGWARKLYTGVVPGTICTIAVGAAGAAGAAGGDTTFTDGTTLITGPGGSGGQQATGASDAADGDSNIGTNGDINGGQPGNSGGGGSGPYGKGGVRRGSSGNGNPGQGNGAGGGGGRGTSNSGSVGVKGIVIITAYIQA